MIILWEFFRLRGIANDVGDAAKNDAKFRCANDAQLGASNSNGFIAAGMLCFFYNFLFYKNFFDFLDDGNGNTDVSRLQCSD